MATILIADDRPVNRQYLVTLLSYFGHRLIEASNGSEALELVKVKQPGLVISDLIMPGMDGQELISRLHADPALERLPVIIYSATYNLQQAQAVAAAVGAFAVLPNPSEPEAILETVNAALGLPPASPPKAADSMRPALPALARRPQGIADLEAISHRLAALIEMSLELASERDPGRLLEGLGHVARKLIGAKYAAVGLLCESATRFRVYVSRGAGDTIESEEVRQGAIGCAPKIELCPRQDSILGRVIEERSAFRLTSQGLRP
jgi:CheY-like chemotaxis protein